MAINEQEKLTVPFANSGLRNEIPQTATGSNLASYEEGFPAVTMTAIASGGQPPTGQDFNGILNVITKILQYAQSGGLYKYDADYAESVNGYPVGAILRSADGAKIWLNTAANNSSDPDNGGQNWAELTNTNALATALSGYLPLNGGTMNGAITRNGIVTQASRNNTYQTYIGGVDVNSSAFFRAFGGEHDTNAGEFRITANKSGTDSKDLIGTPAGSLKWNGNEVLTTASTLDASKLNVSYLPTAGGKMTGGLNIANGDRDGSLYASSNNIYLVSSGGGDGAYIRLCSQDSNTAGLFAIQARNGNSNVALSGSPSGSLTWNGNEVLTTANGLPLDGGTMTGTITSSTNNIISSSTDNSCIYLHGGSGAGNGAQLMLSGKGQNNAGGWWITANNGTASSSLIGNPTGELTWKGINVSAMGMPSGTYTNLTLPASGGSITAPADGYVSIGKSANATSQYIILQNGSIRSEIWSSGSTQYLASFIPVSKGDTVTVTYSAGGSTSFFRFIYAKGSLWERA